MKVKIYCNSSGRIVSLVEIKEQRKVPPTGILPVPDCKECEIDLPEDQARLPLIALHIGYSVDFRGAEPRLVPLAPPKKKQARGKQRE